jgi:hypothetical protein
VEGDDAGRVKGWRAAGEPGKTPASADGGREIEPHSRAAIVGVYPRGCAVRHYGEGEVDDALVAPLDLFGCGFALLTVPGGSGWGRGGYLDRRRTRQ